MPLNLDSKRKSKLLRSQCKIREKKNNRSSFDFSEEQRVFLLNLLITVIACLYLHIDECMKISFTLCFNTLILSYPTYFSCCFNRSTFLSIFLFIFFLSFFSIAFWVLTFFRVIQYGYFYSEVQS